MIFISLLILIVLSAYLYIFIEMFYLPFRLNKKAVLQKTLDYFSKISDTMPDFSHFPIVKGSIEEEEEAKKVIEALRNKPI